MSMVRDTTLQRAMAFFTTFNRYFISHFYLTFWVTVKMDVWMSRTHLTNPMYCWWTKKFLMEMWFCDQPVTDHKWRGRHRELVGHRSQGGRQVSSSRSGPPMEEWLWHFLPVLRGDDKIIIESTESYLCICLFLCPFIPSVHPRRLISLPSSPLHAVDPGQQDKAQQPRVSDPVGWGWWPGAGGDSGGRLLPGLAGPCHLLLRTPQGATHQHLPTAVAGVL